MIKETGYVGIDFANGWQIKQKLSCREYKELYEEATGDTTKIIKNCHYLCENKNCGIITYMEASTVKRNLDKEILSKCKGCTGTDNSSCYYSLPFRVKNSRQIEQGVEMKVPDREEKLKVGDTCGFFKVLGYALSENEADHQRKAQIQCLRCNSIQMVRVDRLLEQSISCQCDKKYASFGESTVAYFLEKNNIPFIPQYTFDDCRSECGGLLRFDFALIDDNKSVVAIIEFDGEQHFELNPFYNPDGKVQVHDEIKNNYLLQHNIPILRIPYYEIQNIESLILDFIKSKR